MTFDQKSSKLNSRPVYCSRLYGIRLLLSHQRFSECFFKISTDLREKLTSQTMILQPCLNQELYKIFTWRQGRCGYLSFILYLSKKYLATVHSTVCPFSNWRGKLCICAGFLVTLQTLENGGKMLVLFGNHGYLILLSKLVF